MSKKESKSILHDYMRDVYEEFSNAVYNEMKKRHPKDKRAVKLFVEASNRLIDQHFGKNVKTACESVLESGLE